MSLTRRSFLGTTAAAFLPWTGAQAAPSDLTGYLRTNWGADPWTKGAYSYVKSNGRQNDRAVLGADWGRVFFAGEAMHPPYNSTVHAAHESGRRAARRITRAGHSSIAIIGAGMAGLTAAHDLAQMGHDVLVIEARNRIGGRILTDRSFGTPLDLGASWIHGHRRNPLIDLAETVGASLDATDDGYVIRGVQGEALPDRAAPDWLDEVSEFQHLAGASSDEVNLAAYATQFDYGGRDMLVTSGMDSLLAALHGRYDIQLGQPVQAVSQTDTGVSITLRSRRVITADATLVTVPLGVLSAGDIAFDPPLPQDRIDAMEGLAMGLLDKLYLRFSEVFWDAHVPWVLTPFNGLRPGQFNQWLNLAPELGEPVILAFNGAGPAWDLSSLSDEDLIDRAQQTLARAYP